MLKSPTTGTPLYLFNGVADQDGTTHTIAVALRH